MRTLIVAALMVVVPASSALATAQTPDKIIYGGTEYMLHTNPLETYFEKHPEKKPQGGVTSTALWRGYVATFEVKDATLLLKDVQIMVAKETADGEFSYEWKSVKETVVAEGKTLPIDWFSGILVLPHGKLLNYVHMGYGSTYSNYILLAVKNGKVTGERKFDHTQYVAFREKQFQAFKKTEAYKKLVEQLKTEDRSEAFVDSFLRSFVLSYTSEFLVEEEKRDGEAAKQKAGESEKADEEKKPEVPADTTEADDKKPDKSAGQQPPASESQAP